MDYKLYKTNNDSVFDNTLQFLHDNDVIGNPNLFRIMMDSYEKDLTQASKCNSNNLTLETIQNLHYDNKYNDKDLLAIYVLGYHEPSNFQGIYYYNGKKDGIYKYVNNMGFQIHLSRKNQEMLNPADKKLYDLIPYSSDSFKVTEIGDKDKYVCFGSVINSPRTILMDYLTNYNKLRRLYPDLIRVKHQQNFVNLEPIIEDEFFQLNISSEYLNYPYLKYTHNDDDKKMNYYLEYEPNHYGWVFKMKPYKNNMSYKLTGNDEDLPASFMLRANNIINDNDELFLPIEGEYVRDIAVEKKINQKNKKNLIVYTKVNNINREIYRIKYCVVYDENTNWSIQEINFPEGEIKNTAFSYETKPLDDLQLLGEFKSTASTDVFFFISQINDKKTELYYSPKRTFLPPEEYYKIDIIKTGSFTERSVKYNLEDPDKVTIEFLSNRTDDNQNVQPLYESSGGSNSSSNSSSNIDNLSRTSSRDFQETVDVVDVSIGTRLPAPIIAPRPFTRPAPAIVPRPERALVPRPDENGDVMLNALSRSNEENQDINSDNTNNNWVNSNNNSNNSSIEFPASDNNNKKEFLELIGFEYLYPKAEIKLISSLNYNQVYYDFNHHRIRKSKINLPQSCPYLTETQLKYNMFKQYIERVFNILDISFLGLIENHQELIPMFFVKERIRSVEFVGGGIDAEGIRPKFFDMVTEEIKYCFFESLDGKCRGNLHVKTSNNLEILKDMSRDFNLPINTLYQLAGACIARILTVDNGGNTDRYIFNNMNLCYYLVDRLLNVQCNHKDNDNWLKYYNFYKQDMPEQFNFLENLLISIEDEFIQEGLDDLSVSQNMANKLKINAKKNLRMLQEPEGFMETNNLKNEYHNLPWQFGSATHHQKVYEESIKNIEALEEQKKQYQQNMMKRVPRATQKFMEIQRKIAIARSKLPDESYFEKKKISGVNKSNIAHYSFYKIFRFYEKDRYENIFHLVQGFRYVYDYSKYLGPNAEKLKKDFDNVKNYINTKDLYRLLRGNTTGPEDIIKATKFKAYGNISETKLKQINNWFNEILREMDESELEKLLKFWINQKSLPSVETRLVVEVKEFNTMINRGLRSDFIKSHTCFLTLVIYDYPTKEVMKEKILTSVASVGDEMYEGFIAGGGLRMLITDKTSNSKKIKNRKSKKNNGNKNKLNKKSKKKTKYLIKK